MGSCKALIQFHGSNGWFETSSELMAAMNPTSTLLHVRFEKSVDKTIK